MSTFSVLTSKEGQKIFRTWRIWGQWKKNLSQIVLFTIIIKPFMHAMLITVVFALGTLTTWFVTIATFGPAGVPGIAATIAAAAALGVASLIFNRKEL
ncbi:ABC-type transport system involved in multi-copper enzyme maturation permease subunit [Pseudarthrobacter sp. PvP004]|uniref:hypothetical protein n=1 Tax=Pseudarthrobacter sp. PvP004 TaxID=2817850 RepID=UPI001AE566F9|nr:hypothetical protein [Pseudarthrobacter sp. PvP004]MBP2266115.1 ABC-type transport system involved in multi-copper enzyme maturation permease subunit [Pseudarthrobacter sp. PvP004]